MRFFHRHHWVVMSNTFNPPMQAKMSYTGFQTEGSLERILYGFTVTTLRCIGCGQLDYKQTNGKAELP